MITHKYILFAIVLNLIMIGGLIKVTSQTAPNSYEEEVFELMEEFDGAESYEYKASNYVSFKEGFSYLQPEADQYFSAKVDPYLTIVPEMGTTGGASNNNEGGIVGSLPGNLTVSNRGAAVYSIPIQLPPGRAGMTPELGLVYSSNRGNGLLGMGWSLSGLSSISRVGTNLYNDGFIDGVDFDEDDQFALNGNRLIEVSTMEYRMEVETFSKIIRHDISGGEYGPEWFEVWTKDGKRIEFGKTEDSRIEGKGKVEVLFWLVNRIEDKKGNFIDYHYLEDNASAEHYIRWIRYTGNINDGLESPFYDIIFNYEYDRPEVLLTRYIGGCRLRTGARLENIEIKYMNEVLINRYELEYLDLFNSYLSKVAVFDKDNVKFNPTLFEYTEAGNEGFSVYPGNENFGNNSGYNDINNPVFMTDVNGDGLSDIVGFNTNGIDIDLSDGYGYWEDGPNPFTLEVCSGDGYDSPKRPRMMADVNGDGCSDIIAFGHSSVTVAVYNSYYEIYESYEGINGFCNEQGFDDDEDDIIRNPRKMADVNGDGMADIIAFGHDAAYVKVSTGTGWIDYPSCPGYGSGDGFDNEAERPRLLADVNGDGMADIIGFGHDDVMVRISTGSGWENYPSVGYFSNADDFNDENCPRMMADVNGDGLADIVGFAHSGAAVRISTGYGWDTYPGHDGFGNEEGFYPHNEHPRKVVDINGDGMADLLGFGHESIKIRLSNGEGWTISHPGYPEYGSDNGWDNEMERPCIPADVNGDGVNDLVGFGHESVRVDVSTSNLNQRLKQVTDGFGITNTTSYEALSRLTGTHYIKGIPPNESVYPILEYQGPLYVVTKLNTSAGYPSETNYYYEEAKIHLRGKGFLGFKKVLTRTPYKDIEKISLQEFSINETFYYPYLSESRIYLEGGELGSHYLNQTFYENAVIPYNDNRIFPYVYRSCSKIKDMNGTYVKTVKSTNLYDNYGNLASNMMWIDPNELDITSEEPAFGFRTATTNIYNPVIYDDWIIGQINESTVVSIHPDSPTDQNEVVTTYDYFNSGESHYPYLKSELVVPNGSNTLKVKVEYDYDEYGNIKKKINSAPGASPAINPRITNYFFEDTHNRFLTKTQKTVNGILHENSAEYDPVTGQMISDTDVNGLITTYEYDGFGKLTKTTMPDNNTIIYVLRWSNEHLDAPEGGVALYNSWSKASGKAKSLVFYDELGNELRFVTEGYAENSKIYHDNVYNQYYELLSSHEPYFSGESYLSTSYAYDYLGRAITIVPPNDATYTYTYDGNEVTKVKSNVENTISIETSKTVNAIGQPELFDDAGGIVDYDYHKSGNVKEITCNGVSVTMDYDAAGRQTVLNDPDAGTSTYVYNTFGELVSQADQKGNNYTMIYDDFGRLLQKTLEGSTDVTTYVYDTEENGIGLLASITGSSHTNFTYNEYSRLIDETETFDGTAYTSAYDYNCFGDVSKKTFPSGFELKYIFNHRGYLKYIKAPDIDTKVWLAEEINAKGQVEQFLLGNGLRANYDYDQYGFPDKISTDNYIQEHDFDFDPFTGNLLKRKDLLNNIEETFTYDDTKLHNRLMGYQVGTQQYTINYLDNGNIDSKSDVGTYAYGTSSRPHAVESLTYDQTANPGYADNQYITYNAFNSIETISEADAGLLYNLNVTYGNDEQRIKTELNQGGSLVKEKLFIGSNFEIELDGLGQNRILHYIDGIAIYVIEPDGSDNLYYLHKDYLGSYYSVTDEDGNLAQKNGVDQVYSFDPWGQRRNPTDWTYGLVPAEFLFDRGFTGHEHLDDFGLINMNGRAFDPVLARMLSPDNFVQSTEYSQGFNRYSYCYNNPLMYTDHSGETPANVIGAIVGAAVGGTLNLVMNWDNCDGIWEYTAAFGIGAAGGAVSGALLGTDGGASFWAVVGAGAATGAFIAGTNDIIAQTDYNFQGNVDWNHVGQMSASGLVSGALSSSVGYGISSSTLINGSIRSPMLRSLIASPVTSGVGHWAGGTAYGMLNSQDFYTASDNAFEGIGNSMLIGTAIGLSSTYISAKYNKISPWTGKSLASRILTKNGIYGTQKGLNPEISDTYLEQMRTNTFNENQAIGGFTSDGKYYLGEGHHRMNAAYRYYQETGSNYYINHLINTGRWTNGVPSSYGLKIYKLD